MIALIWKEWQEAKRPFVGGLIVLVGLPLMIVIIYRLFVDDEWGFGAATFSTALFAPIIAATWGAHVVCKDLATAQGCFLFAQPVRPARVMVAKIAVAVALLLSLVAVPTLIDSVGLSVTSDIGGLFDERTGIPPRLCVLFLLGLLGTLAASFLAGVVFKRLVPAILVGLVAAVFLLFGPQLWLSASPYAFAKVDEFGGLAESRWHVLLGCLVAAVAAVALFLASVVAARRPERSPVSLKPLAWTGVGVFLACTAAVTGTIGNNTIVTHDWKPEATTNEYSAYYVQTPQVSAVWTLGHSVYWLAFVSPNKDGANARYDVEVATFDDAGQLSRGPRTAASFPAENVWAAHLVQDGHAVELLRHLVTSPNETTWELASVDLTGEIDAETQVLHLSRTRPYEWVYADERLIRLTAYWSAEAEEYERYVEVVSSGGDSGAILGKLAFKGWDGWGGWIPAELDLEGDTLTIWYRHLYGGRSGWVIRVDIADPTHPTIVLESNPYPTPSTALSRLAAYFDDWSATFHEGKLALSSIGGLWIYELTPEGGWKLLGMRRASFIEPLAGRLHSRLMWKGDRIYEYSYGFGLLVYDVSDPTHPRRIAHAGIPIREIAPLDNGLIAILTADHALEIHRLPRD